MLEQALKLEHCVHAANWAHEPGPLAGRGEGIHVLEFRAEAAFGVPGLAQHCHLLAAERALEVVPRGHLLFHTLRPGAAVPLYKRHVVAFHGLVRSARLLSSLLDPLRVSQATRDDALRGQLVGQVAFVPAQDPHLVPQEQLNASKYWRLSEAELQK